MDRRTSLSLSLPRQRRVAIGGLLLAVAGLGYGCFERALKPVNPCTTSVQGQVIQVNSVDKVDMLLMIDNSNSMTEEQASVVSEIPRIVEILTSGHDNSGVIPDFTPARSLHIGIIDSDMGLGNISGISTCDPGFGDDGLMQIRARHPTGSCMSDYSGTYPGSVFDFDVAGSRTPAQFAQDVACVATLGTDGCGFEFELEAPLKALSMSPEYGVPTWVHTGYVPPVFAGPSYGHGNDPATNGAFLRADSALAVVTINDEDDCSTQNFNIFSLDDSTDLNLRCHVYQDQLYPIDRYRDGFLGLRQNPALLIYAAITGIPPERAGQDPAAILMDPAMVEQQDPANPNRLLPACVSPGGRGVAYPAIRMTELARQLDGAGAAVTVQSICNTDFSAAFSEIIRIVSNALSGACLARQLNPDADGNVDCDVLEALPPVGSGASYERCDQLIAENPTAYELDHTETTMNSDGTSVTREVCRITQVGHSGAGTLPGWAYDTRDNEVPGWSMIPMGCNQRIGLSMISAVPGAEVRLQCNETILPSTHADAQLGSPCDPATGIVTGGTAQCSAGTAVAGNPRPLACDSFDRSCQIACTSDADCTAAGLLSYVCDHRTASSYFGGDDRVPTGITPGDEHGFCVNPTCGSANAAN